MNARRTILTILIGLAALAGVAASERAVAQAPAERVVMTPADGTLHTRFTFYGSGFVPGRTVAVRLTLPDGSERRFRTDEGVELVWKVMPDGTFILELVPAERFPGAVPGRWQALFCAFEAPTCQQLSFEVGP